ncbi:MAG TPA: hypothetical protein VLL54_18440 [Pyrinomonadaceae bacterium]|nr:hypothetical protein [Pyrinomonadaceae bacterium]
MSKHQEWKMVHLLYGNAHRSGDRYVLTEQELVSAGVHCNLDTFQFLEDAGVVTRVGNEYELSKPARQMLNSFTVAQGPETRKDIRVDYPEVFVVMPFSEDWSDDVFTKMIEPGISDAGFVARRGDSIVRVGNLGTNVWGSITQAGVIVAEVSVHNPNVFYEIGLADALGKPVFLFKQQDATLPADFRGEHYYEYERNDLQAARQKLAKGLEDWAKDRDHQPFGVKALVDS